jgi:hypothetical protein
MMEMADGWTTREEHGIESLAYVSGEHVFLFSNDLLQSNGKHVG